MTSFRVQFKKVGGGLLREAKQSEGEWAVLVKAKGDECLSLSIFRSCSPI